MPKEINISSMTTEEIIEDFRDFFHGIGCAICDSEEFLHKNPKREATALVAFGRDVLDRGRMLLDELEEAYEKNHRLQQRLKELA